MSSPTDVNADDKLRLRRNAQRAGRGGTALPSVVPPLDTSSGSISLDIGSTGGLTTSGGSLVIKPNAAGAVTVGASGLAVSVDGSSIVINGSDQLAVGLTFQSVTGTGGLTVTTTGSFVTFAVNVGPGLKTATNQVQVKVDGVSVTTDGFNQLVATPTGSGAGLTSLPLSAADTSITIGGGGLTAKVGLATSSGLVVSSGLKANVDGSSITINGSNQLVAHIIGSGSGLTSLPLTAADTSITVGGSGLTVKAALATNSGLAVSSGLLITTAAANGTTASAGGILVTGFQQLSSDPGSPVPGQGWFNSTVGLYKTDLGMVGNFLTGVWIGTNSSVITNTAALTDFTPNKTIPAGFWHLIGRTIRATAIVGGGGVSGTFTPFLQMNSTTVWTGPAISSTTFSNLWIELLITVISTGSPDQVLVLGRTFNASNTMTAANAVTNVDFTINQTLQWAGQFSTASTSNSAQMSYWTFELIA